MGDRLLWSALCAVIQNEKVTSCETKHRRDIASRADLQELSLGEASPEIDSLRDHLFLPSKEEADKILRYEAMFMRQLDHATAELERLQFLRKSQDLPNEPTKPFEMNAPLNVVAFKKDNRGGGDEK